MHCRHICAVIEHEAASVQAEAKTPRFASTLHRVVQPDAEVRKRSGPPRAVPQRPLAEGTRVVVRAESGETQVGVVVGNARETCDVKFSKDKPRTRVPIGSILQWVKTGKLTGTATAAVKGTVQPGKKKRMRAMEQAAGTLDGGERGDAGPKAVRWGFKLRDVSLRNTCSYDAVFAPLMHVLRSNVPLLVFVRNRLAQDQHLQGLHDVYTCFWDANADVNEVSAAWPGGVPGGAWLVLGVTFSRMDAAPSRRVPAATGSLGVHEAVRAAHRPRREQRARGPDQPLAAPAPARIASPV
jgi:hypothetical protein